MLIDRRWLIILPRSLSILAYVMDFKNISYVHTSFFPFNFEGKEEQRTGLLKFVALTLNDDVCLGRTWKSITFCPIRNLCKSNRANSSPRNYKRKKEVDANVARRRQHYWHLGEWGLVIDVKDIMNFCICGKAIQVGYWRGWWGRLTIVMDGKKNIAWSWQRSFISPYQCDRWMHQVHLLSSCWFQSSVLLLDLGKIIWRHLILLRS
jgi:hypothetical protein